MRTALYAVTATLGWAVLAVKLSHLRKDPTNPTLRALCVTLAFLALAFTLVPPLVWSIEQAVGVPAIWTSGTVVAACAAYQTTLLLWTYPIEEARPRITRRLAAYGAALTLMLVLDLQARPAPPALRDEFLNAPELVYGQTPYAAHALIVYLLVVGYTAVDAARHFRRYARLMDRRWLRSGLRIIAVGNVFTLGYCAAMVTFVGALQAGVTLTRAEDVATLLAGIAVITATTGLAVPAVGPRVDRWRDYRRIHPLWAALSRATPDVVLRRPNPTAARWWTVRGLSFRLYRRVIEIRDSRLALRPYLDRDTAELADQLAQDAGLHGIAHDATVEAALLAAAIRRKDRDRPAVNPAISDSRGGTDLADEITWIKAVATAFTTSPVVRAVAARTEAERATSAQTTTQ